MSMNFSCPSLGRATRIGAVQTSSSSKGTPIRRTAESIHFSAIYRISNCIQDEVNNASKKLTAMDVFNATFYSDADRYLAVNDKAGYPNRNDSIQDGSLVASWFKRQYHGFISRTRFDYLLRNLIQERISEIKPFSEIDNHPVFANQRRLTSILNKYAVTKIDLSAPKSDPDSSSVPSTKEESDISDSFWDESSFANDGKRQQATTSKELTE